MEEWQKSSEKMIQEQIFKRNIRDPRLIEAMRKVPRHLFLDPMAQKLAYEDRPVPIGWEQTISQPYIVAYMLEQLCLQGHERVLEIGTGSGYDTALLAHLCAEVYTIEIIPELMERAGKTLASLGLAPKSQSRLGDGCQGWPEACPFDAIIVTAGTPRTPAHLKEQLAPGGRLLFPLGDAKKQRLIRILRDPGSPVKYQEKKFSYVLFVPIQGEAQKLTHI